MRAELNNGGRWDHIASETELKAALRGKPQVCEWPKLGHTYMCNEQTMTIVRCDSMGGDTRSIEGGWVYTNPFSMLRDWQEIVQVGSLSRG